MKPPQKSHKSRAEFPERGFVAGSGEHTYEEDTGVPPLPFQLALFISSSWLLTIFIISFITNRHQQNMSQRSVSHPS